MSSSLLYLLIAALALYVIVRQFMEQQVTWSTLLLLPALSVYESYTELQKVFLHFSVGLVLGGLALGLVIGVITGIYRGLYTKVRLNSSNGVTYSKPQLPSSLIWVGLLVVRIAASVFFYNGLDKTSMLFGLFTIAVSILFLISISTQKYIVFQKAARLRGIPNQRNA